MLAVSQYQMPLRTTLRVFSKTRLEIWKLFMISLLLDLVLRTVSNTGPSETHGVPISVRMVSSDLLEELTTSLSRPTALGPLQRIPGPSHKSISLLQKSRLRPLRLLMLTP